MVLALLCFTGEERDPVAVLGSMLCTKAFAWPVHGADYVQVGVMVIVFQRETGCTECTFVSLVSLDY